MMSSGGQREYWTKLIMIRMQQRGLISRPDWGFVSKRLMRRKVADLKLTLKRFAIPKGGTA